MKLNLTAKKFYSEGDITHEYNPLHNGHKHQIDEIKALFKNDAFVICLLSSNFVEIQKIFTNATLRKSWS